MIFCSGVAYCVAGTGDTTPSCAGDGGGGVSTDSGSGTDSGNGENNGGSFGDPWNGGGCCVVGVSGGGVNASWYGGG